jgi:N-acetyl-gamma-glutamyl-phosphate reductase
VSQTIQAVVLGATGYVGGELLRLIAAHPDFELVAAVSDRCQEQEIADTFPHLAGALAGQRFIATDQCLANIDRGADLALFSAAPHGASAAVIERMLSAAEQKNLNTHVVDSSADFRYPKQADYEAVSGGTHGAPGLWSQFYSAVPEHAVDVPVAHIGHPGCFATAVLLAAVPLLKSGLTDAEIFVSGTTGSTGSGRSPGEGTHHPERHSNLYAYKPLAHRHAPEIAQLSAAASGRQNKVHFVPHSGPFARGIYATVQAKTPRAVSVRQLRDTFSAAYAESPFVQIVDSTPRLKNVVASNYCHIGVAVDEDAVVVMTAIDNLVKGAAGGAVQWMNRLWQLPETNGLLTAAPGWI